MRNATTVLLVLLLASLSSLCGCKSTPDTPAERAAMQDEIRAVARTTLDRLYMLQPAAKEKVEGAAGHAVFTNYGLKLVIFGGGGGQGLAVDNATRAETFMRMAEVQAGLGLGAKKFSVVWVFATKDGLRNFIDSGWSGGGSATAAATTGDSGAAAQGAVTVSPGVWVYQMTDAGLALELSIAGTKYYKDDALNN